MVDSDKIFQADLIEYWLKDKEFDFKVSDTKMTNVFKNRWRVDLYGPSKCPMNISRPILKSYFLVVDGSVSDKTIEGVSDAL